MKFLILWILIYFFSLVVLPRLAALAAKNNSTTNETKKMDIALALLEAFTAMSCCCILWTWFICILCYYKTMFNIGILSTCIISSFFPVWLWISFPKSPAQKQLLVPPLIIRVCLGLMYCIFMIIFITLKRFNNIFCSVFINVLYFTRFPKCWQLWVISWLRKHFYQAWDAWEMTSKL